MQVMVRVLWSMRDLRVYLMYFLHLRVDYRRPVSWSATTHIVIGIPYFHSLDRPYSSRYHDSLAALLGRSAAVI